MTSHNYVLSIVGNRRFRMIIDQHLDTYMEVMSRSQKTKIVTTIVKNIRTNAAQSGGGFVRKDLLTRRWFKVSDKLAREKVGQALRDAIKTRRSTGTKKPVKSGKKIIDSHGLRNMIDEQVVQFPVSKTQSQNVVRSAASPTSADAAGMKRGAGFQGVTYTQQLVAELEPTPIRAQSLNHSGVFDRSSMAHQRSETSASTLLRLFDEGTAKGDSSAVEAAAVAAAAAAAVSQARRLSLSQMAFHPIGDLGSSLMSLKNDFKFF
jgi:hypothetical protein